MFFATQKVKMNVFGALAGLLFFMMGTAVSNSASPSNIVPWAAYRATHASKPVKPRTTLSDVEKAVGRNAKWRSERLGAGYGPQHDLHAHPPEIFFEDDYRDPFMDIFLPR